MAKKSNLSFEEAIDALEDCVAKLESGKLTLDESMAQFENAVQLVRACTEKIESAKQRVRIITDSDDGSISDKPFDYSDEN